jgi:hypothetical protein
VHVIVPALVPLAPDLIVNHPLPDVTAAVQSMVPAPELNTLNVVVPTSLGTLRLRGERTNDPDCPPRTARIGAFSVLLEENGEEMTVEQTPLLKSTPHAFLYKYTDEVEDQ